MPEKQINSVNDLYNVKEDFEMSQAEVCFALEGSLIDLQMNRPYNELYILPKDRATDKKKSSPRRMYKKRDMFR